MTETNLDFDTIINRTNTKCLKYDFAEKRGYPKDVLPLWVADMDFRTSSYVEEAIKKAVEHNIYGYTNIRHGDGFFDAVCAWMQQHHDFTPQERWLVHTPGVVFAICMAIRALTNPGDAVLIQQPVYYPFSGAVKSNGRVPVSSDLVRDEQGNYQIDFEDFERVIVAHQVKLFILCNPHNPVGRVWTREELSRIGRICRERGVIVFSDEIHFDFIWNGDHHVFQEVEESFREFTITATSASKTFNLAGLQQANLFIPDETIRRKLIHEVRATGYDEPSLLGIAATQAAYEHGEMWYASVKAYIEQNIDYAVSYVAEHIPGVQLVKPEGTYLIWLGFTKTGVDANELDDLIVNKAKLWLDSGRIFGSTGAGFQRINTACPRSVLAEALGRIKALEL
ncbi:MAG: pyridoxal phosphate-dependent aminotransferase [Lachnospiraceae bacterium]|nr:pyridoxal phosphate-dependent aminotransferase [Lachnospiraceae bacterium]